MVRGELVVCSLCGTTRETRCSANCLMVKLDENVFLFLKKKKNQNRTPDVNKEEEDLWKEFNLKSY